MTLRSSSFFLKMQEDYQENVDYSVIDPRKGIIRLKNLDREKEMFAYFEKFSRVESFCFDYGLLVDHFIWKYVVHTKSITKFSFQNKNLDSCAFNLIASLTQLKSLQV